MLKHLGKYKIMDQIGKGSMGTVYKARDQHIGRIVAVKTIKLPDTSDAEKKTLTERFKQEAMAAGNLNHPHIVTIYEYDEVDGIAFIAMEFVEGVELKSRLDNNEVFTESQIIQIMKQLLAALEYSHQHGVVHRDIKPSNLMITTDGQVKVTDFGIARLESSELTQAGVTLGTPSYMSPEQCTGQAVDARSDIFSAGVLMYQLLTGERPFTGPTITSILHKITQVSPPAPSQLNYAISSSLDLVVAKSLAKRPSERFPSAAAFADALTDALTNRENQAVSSSSRQDTSLQQSNRTSTVTEETVAIPLDETSNVTEGTIAIPLDETSNVTEGTIAIPLDETSDITKPRSSPEPAADSTIAVPLHEMHDHQTSGTHEKKASVHDSGSGQVSTRPRKGGQKPKPLLSPSMPKYLFILAILLILITLGIITKTVILPDAPSKPVTGAVPRQETAPPKMEQPAADTPMAVPPEQEMNGNVTIEKNNPSTAITAITPQEQDPPREQYNCMITSDPPDVIIEHETMGILANTTPVKTVLAPGIHQLYVTRDGYQDLSIVIEIEEKRTQNLKLHLSRRQEE